jgi:hypothetical protein
MIVNMQMSAPTPRKIHITTVAVVNALISDGLPAEHSMSLVEFPNHP